MTGDNLSNGVFGNFMQGIADTLARGFNSIGNSFSGIWDYFINHTVVGNILGFIWDIIMFLLYGVRSIILLVRNILYNILNGSTELFSWLLDTFEDLSVFMGTSTSLLISMFVLVLLILGFQFIFRFFTGKYHYKKEK